MQVYVVRMIKDKTAFGIFWAEDPRELFMMIDEKADPGAFECLIARDSGGLFFNEGYAEWRLGVKERPNAGDPDWNDDDDNTATESRLATVTRHIEFSEQMNEMLSGSYEVSGFVPLSTLIHATARRRKA